MKKLLLMTVALLSLGAALAYAADGMNLAWGACRTSANNATATTNDMTNPNPCNDGLLAGTKRIVASMKNGTTILNFSGCTIELPVHTGSGQVPDYWDFSGAGCRGGAVSALPTSTNATNCVNPYRPGGVNNDPAGEDELSNVNTDNIATGVIVYQADHVRKTTPLPTLGPPASTGGYLVDNVAFDQGLGADVCAGCDAPACIELQFVKYFSFTESRTILATELRNWITANGGTGGACSSATPTRNTTWGQVKALYR